MKIMGDIEKYKETDKEKIRKKYLLRLARH